MLNQSFTSRGLVNLTTRKDVRRFDLWQDNAARDTVIQAAVDQLNDANYTFPPLREKRVGANVIYSASDYETAIGLRKIDRDLRHIYKVRQANRHRVVAQVQALCRESCPYSVLRLDIKSFYENAPRKKILKWINDDGYVSFQSLRLLNELLESPQFKSTSGLPRGLAISATLSELSLRHFDRLFRQLDHVYYYGRYVDDIIVFSVNSLKDVEEDVKQIAEQCKTDLNADKYTPIRITDNVDAPKTLTYLGYEIEICSGKPTAKRWREVRTRIADQKLKKIKSRIITAFFSFSKDDDFTLLLLRMRILTSNFPARNRIDSGLLAGIAFNYHAAESCASQLDNLQEFYNRNIFISTGPLGRALAGKLTDEQKITLKRLSFNAGYTEKRKFDLSEGDLRRAFRCWRYEKN